MIVITIIAIVATIAVPKLSQMVRNANEAATKGKVGSIRSALTIYYADNEGFYPATLDPLMQPGSKYLTGMVPLYTFDHGNSYNVDYFSTPDYASDNGQWGYVNAPRASAWGSIWVECTHTDARGRIWTQY